MNIIAMGIGPYGNAVAEQLCSNNALSRCVAVCSTKSEFESTKVEAKIRVSTRLSPPDAIERINGKVSKACAEADVAVLIANPMDFVNPAIIYLIAKCIQAQNVIPVGIIVEPFSKTDRKHRKAIQNTLDVMVSSFASAVIPEQYVADYIADPNTRWLEAYVSCWNGRDAIQEFDTFHKWKKSLSKSIDDLSAGIQVGEFIACRLLDFITTNYINADISNVHAVLSVPGHLHFSTVCAAGEDCYELIKWRASFNDVLRTTSHAAKGMLLTLTVPKSTTPKDVGKICLGIYGYANESVNFYFNIKVSEREDDVVFASVLATGTYDMSEDDY